MNAQLNRGLREGRVALLNQLEALFDLLHDCCGEARWVAQELVDGLHQRLLNSSHSVW
jgi:hypothetical protein